MTIQYDTYLKNMTDEFEQKWKSCQLSGWQDDVSDINIFFQRLDIDTVKIFNDLFVLDYDRVQPVMYLVGKIQKMMAVCDFLDTLAKDKHEDVDKIKIFQLVSHSEIVMNNLGVSSAHTKKADLVSMFFAPVIDQLKYKLQLGIESANELGKKNQDISASSILYKLRNEYAHQGNFTGRIFMTDSDNSDGIIFLFDWDLKVGKESITVCGDNSLTYNKFLDMYFTAFKTHLENYISKRSSS